MATVFEKILLAGTSESFAALTSKDANKLYFLTDTKQIYKGSELYTDSVRKVSTKPTTPATNVVYHITDTETFEYYDGSAWVTLRPEISTTLSAASTDDQIATAKAIYDYVAAQLEDMSTSENTVKSITDDADTEAGIVVTKGDGSTSKVTVSGVVTTPSYDSTTRTITLPVAGGETVTIALGKDIFVDSTKDNKYNAETGNIELYLNDGTKIEIPASGLVDVYTGDATTTATVTVSDDNKISVAVKLSTESDNAISVDATNGGLYLSLAEYAKTTYVDTQVKAVADDLDTAETNITALQTAVNTLNGDATTEGSVAKQVADAKSALQTSVDDLTTRMDTAETNITNLQTRVTALEDAFGWGTF